MINLGTIIVLKNDSGEVLMGVRKNSYLSGSYGLPGGRLEVGEPIEQAIKRELKEEADLEVETVEWVGVVRETQKDYDFVHFVFKSNAFMGELKNVEPDRCQGWEWISVNELPENMMPAHKQAVEMSLKENGQLVDLT